MQLHDLKLNFKYSRKKRVGRGGKRGSYSGRGVKGQGARAGHRKRPADRDLLIRTPKLRGYRNKPFSREFLALNVGDLENRIKGSLINLETAGRVKILGSGSVKKAFTVQGLKVSKGAKEKIEKAGGTVK